MLTSHHSIFIYASCRCRWSPHLSHLAKYWGSYTCLNLGSPGKHSLATAVPGRCPGKVPLSDCRNSKLTPPIKVFLRLMESPRHKLRIPYGITLVPLSLRGWEAFPTPGGLTHTRITWALSPTTLQVSGVIPGSPLCSWCFRDSSWRAERYERTLVNFVSTSFTNNHLYMFIKACSQLTIYKWCATPLSTFIHNNPFANVPLSTFLRQSCFCSSKFCHNPSSSCVTQMSLVYHSIKQIEFLITLPPTDRLQPLGQWCRNPC